MLGATLVVVVGVCLGMVILLTNLGTRTENLRCDGWATEKLVEQPGNRSVHDDARLGLTINRYRIFLFWRDTAPTAEASLYYRDSSTGRIGTGILSTIELDNITSTTAWTDMFADDDPKLYYDDRSGYASLLIPGDYMQVEFDGYCEEAEPVI